MYFQGPRIVLLLVLAVAQHAFSLDMQLFNNLQALKNFLPGIYPQLMTYVPPPKDRTACPKPPPGVRKLFQGVDVTNFDFYPKDGFNQGFKSTVLNMACKKSASWHDTKGHNYDIPDQMLNGLNTNGAGSGSETVKVFKSSSDVRKEMTKTAGLSADVGFFSFSSSVSYKSMEQTIQESSSFIQEVAAYEGTAKATISLTTLDKHAQDFVDHQLIGTFETNRTVYEKFIEMYGTHYFVRANLGGTIKAVIATKSDFLSKSKAKDLSVSAKATFSGLVKSGSISFGLDKGKSSTNTNFNEASSTSIRYYGGSANLLMGKGFTSWTPTVDGDPWVVNGILKPIYKLIKDPLKRRNLKLAVNKHIYRSYYKELVRSRGGARIIDKIKDILVKSSETKSWTIKEYEKMKVMEPRFVTPQWFTYGIEVCYGSRKEREVKHRCINPNKHMLDHQARRFINDGGSKDMVYSLKTLSEDKKSDALFSNFWKNKIFRETDPFHEKVPDWFNNKVKLCVRYQGDKDTQCKGSGEQCADVNTYTSLTYKYSAGAKADCNLSWKLSIPSEAPVWLDETKLCLAYGLHGSNKLDKNDLAEQCNLAVNPERHYELCAAVNEWTPYWRDGTTDVTHGKCWMRLLFKSLLTA